MQKESSSLASAAYIPLVYAVATAPLLSVATDYTRERLKGRHVPCNPYTGICAQMKRLLNKNCC